MTAAIPVLLYHSVRDDPAPWIAPFTVTPAAFARQLRVIADSGRTAITVSQLAAGITGREPLPDAPIVITFDDGFADFSAAAEAMADLALPSTLYVTTGALCGRGPQARRLAIPAEPMLFFSQLPHLEAQGVEIAAHSHTHPQLDVVPDSVVREELIRSKDVLEQELGHEVPSFAYPHGFHCARTRRLVAETGYRSACAVRNRFSSREDDVLALARLTIRSTTTLSQFADLVLPRREWAAPRGPQWRTAAWRWYRRARGSASSKGVIDAAPMGSAAARA